MKVKGDVTWLRDSCLSSSCLEIIEEIIAFTLSYIHLLSWHLNIYVGTSKKWRKFKLDTFKRHFLYYTVFNVAVKLRNLT